MPFTSRRTITAMAQNLVGKRSTDCEFELASLICVASFAGYFLQEIVLSGHGVRTGIEDELRLQAQMLFTTARVSASRLLQQGVSSNMSNLQALTYAVSHQSRLYSHVVDREIDTSRPRNWRFRTCMDNDWHSEQSVFRFESAQVLCIRPGVQVDG